MSGFHHLFICSDASSVDQRPSSPERGEDLGTGCFTDITAGSPSRETANDPGVLQVATENLSHPGIPEVLDGTFEPSSLANVMDEILQTAAPDS